MSLNNSEMIEVYKTIVGEMHNFLQAHQTRVVWFVGLISAVFAGIVVGIFKATTLYHLLFLLLGPIIIIVLSKIAIKGVFRFYQQFLETVTFRAKIEQVLGLTQPPELPSDLEQPYWADDPFIAPRHMDSRIKFKSSKEWLEYRTNLLKKHQKNQNNLGYNRWTNQLFRGIQWAAGILLIILLFMIILVCTNKLNLISSKC